ncbi:ATP-binding protein [Fusicatenibacter sp.]
MISPTRSSFGERELPKMRYTIHIIRNMNRKIDTITTNLPMGRWDELFTGKLAAAAILDRLVHHCHVISITGDSYRVKGRKTEYKKRKA